MHAVSAAGSAVAFLCLAFALLLVSNLDRLEARWQTAGQLSVYLKPETSDQRLAEAVRAIRASAGVARVRHVSAELARAELLDGNPTALLEALPESAFPASIEIELVPELSSDRVAHLTAQLVRLPIVESVETYAAWTRRIAHFVHAANVVLVCLSLVVFLAVVTVVGSSTKLLLERRRNEVEVLRIVGATSDYVRRPFLIEGAAQGGLGALGAVILCGFISVFLYGRFDVHWTTLLGIEPRFLSLLTIVGLLATGGVLGALAAFFSLRRSFSA